MKKGFTLVELSIVLVIIGLLIGGILVGQSLIESAKVQGYIKRIQQFEVAFDLFESKFGQLPGDSNFFTPAGNNDGKIYLSDFGCNGLYENAEFNYTFPHLSQAQMIKEQYSAYSPTVCGGGDSHADSPINFAANDFMPGIGYSSQLWAGAVGYGVNPKIGLTLQTVPGLSIVGEGRYFTSGLDVLSTVSIDEKLDDGDGLTGSFKTVVASDWVSSCNSAINNPDSTVCAFDHKWGN